MNIINAFFRVGLALFFIPAYGCAEDYFNPAFLTLDEGVSSDVDLSQFEQHGAQAPGQYEMNVKLNHFDIQSMTIDLEPGAHQPLVARFTKSQLSTLGIDLRQLPELNLLSAQALTPPLEELISGAISEVDFLSHTIRLSVPQKNIERQAQGTIPPEKWDDGITTLFTNYAFSGSLNRQQAYGSQNNNYLNLHNGLNMGAWRVRNTAIWSNNRWDSTNTYVTRNLLLFGGSRFTLGQYWSNSLLFDTFQFKGVTLESDDSMLPESMKGFAPTIRGIAKTDARVEVKQNGFTVYEDWVPPGRFEIRDLHPTTASGDLQVNIYESTGEVRSFQEPYSAVPVMQREGQVKYTVSSGIYGGNAESANPEFVQSTLAYGMSTRLTAYAGIIAAADYFSWGTGMGFGLGYFGSLSTDFVRTQGHPQKSSVDKELKSGYMHMQYAKIIQPTSTGVTVESYFYNNKSYRSFSDFNSRVYDGNNRFNLQRKMNATISQPLPAELGEIFFSSSINKYWEEQKSDTSFTLGYTLYYKDVSYNLTFAQTRSTESSGNDRQVALSVQIPLGVSHTNTWLSWNGQSSNHERSRHQVGLNGVSLKDNALSWSIQQSFGANAAVRSGNMQANYRSRYHQSNVGYSYNHDSHSQQLNYGINGGIVAHQEGVTFSQPIGDTFALISTGHVRDIKLEHTTNISTDSEGYAVVPYLTPYHHNSLAIDPTSFSAEVEADKTRKDAVPTKGAVILRRFDLKTGHKALFTLLRKKHVVPFGANVTLRGSDIMSMVGDNGEVYLSGLPDHGALHVSWGKGEMANCSAAYRIDNPALTNGIFINDLECQ